MKKLDPTKMQDWEIAGEAESAMKTIDQLGDELGIDKMELMPYGHYVGKINYMLLDKKLEHRPRGKYIVVTAITPTPLGEGKTTTTIGLVQGLGHLGKKVIGAIRQPSGGPTFNIKGSAAGGGLSQCIPLADFSLGLTGDIDAVTNAHNLAMVALTSRIQHEFNYTDDFLKKRGLRRLNINPKTATMGWAMDFCAQSLRNIIIGLGGPTDGFMMESSFQIAVSSEVMAILAIAKDLKDMRERIDDEMLRYMWRLRPVIGDGNGQPLTPRPPQVCLNPCRWREAAGRECRPARYRPVDPRPAVRTNAGSPAASFPSRPMAVRGPRPSSATGADSTDRRALSAPCPND